MFGFGLVIIGSLFSFLIAIDVWGSGLGRIVTCGLVKSFLNANVFVSGCWMNVMFVVFVASLVDGLS